MPERIDWKARAVAAEVALEVARRDRSAAIARAAGLRQALELLLWSCVPNGEELTVPSRCVVYEVTAALDPPGPSIGEIKAEALEETATALSAYVAPQPPSNYWCGVTHGHLAAVKELRAEAARLRGGGK